LLPEHLVILIEKPIFSANFINEIFGIAYAKEQHELQYIEDGNL
jgi:hypothetical protein